MSAIVGVLNESLTEAIKSFYKLRKAFITLESVMDAEKKYVGKQSSSTLNSADSAPPSRPISRSSVHSTPLNPEAQSTAASTQSLNTGRKAESKETKGGDEDDEFDFVDADEDHEGAETPIEYMGHIAVPLEKGESAAVDNSERQVDITSSSASDLPSNPQPDSSLPSIVSDFEKLTHSSTVQEGQDISIFGDHPIDIFIISGSNFCFGILLLMISLVPPAFSTLLKIVGFKGDRERGIQMLWQASKFHNIHGAMAGLVLFGYYQVVSFCDIIRREAYPKEKCRALLADMRIRYPNSALWSLEEARSISSDKELERAVEFISSMPVSKLKQLEALRWFETSLMKMYLHDYEGTSAGFLKCVSLNSWSHGLYYYICGAAHVELYRRNKTVDPEAAAKQKEKAVAFFMKVAPNTGKKRFMQRQLPFDIFINRKIQKWEARAKEWDCDLIDAVGVSPLEEMIYFWSGAKKMRNDHLQKSLDNLAWSESKENPYWEKEDLDEKSILILLRAAALRNMGDTVQAKQILQSDIIAHDRALFKGPMKDSWTAPVARYEMAASIWKEADRDAKPEAHLDMLQECKAYVEEASNWEKYDLDTRYAKCIFRGFQDTTANVIIELE